MVRLLLLLGAVLATVVLSQGSDDLDRISRIIGGEKVTDIKKWPWLVALTASKPETKLGALVLSYRTYYCGGSVINKRWIMTAAHCTDNGLTEPKYWNVRVASLRRSANVGEQIKDFFGMLFNRDDWRSIEFKVDKVIRHEEYSPARSWANDIALLRVTKDIPVSGPDVDEIELPEDDPSFPVSGQQCVMKGWGCEKGGGPVANFAKEVILPIVDNWGCGRMWGIDTTSRICAGEQNQNKGICPGDSGGPLVCQKEGKWVQVGIASFTSRDHPESHYGAFTRVSHFADWIQRNIKRTGGGGGGGF